MKPNENLPAVIAAPGMLAMIRGSSKPYAPIMKRQQAGIDCVAEERDESDGGTVFLENVPAKILTDPTCAAYLHTR